MLGCLRSWPIPLLLAVWVVPVVAQDVVAQDTDTEGTTDPLGPAESERSADFQKIEAAIASYVDAFNAKDVDKLLSFWTTDGVYVSRTSGDLLSGHDELKQEFSAILGAEDAPNLAVQTESIEFVSPNVAVERGSALVTGKDFTDQSTYRVVYVEREGRWLIDRVTEDIQIPRASNYEQLQGLDFLVGQWAVEGDGMAVQLDSQWTTNQNYLSTKYSVAIDGVIESSGLQIIGWDAKNQQIRSWLFDSNGGFVKGTWEQRENAEEWVVQSVATLADGAAGSSTSIYRPEGPDSFSWRKTNRVVDGKLLPNTQEVIMRRQ